MNRERIEQCIDMMKRAKNLNMLTFQGCKDENPVCDNISQLHACGNTACFAGYLAISDFFKRAGGEVSETGSGAPVYTPLYDTGYGWEHRGSSAVAEFLGIGYEIASDIVNGINESEQEGSYCSFYGKDFEDVTPEDVIQKLQMILDGELQ